MTSSSIKRFLSIIGEADEIDGVGKMSSDTQRVFMTDDIYPIDWDYFPAVRQRERGGASGMFLYGYYYGFERGRKAQKAEGRRKRRAEKRKEATAHD